MGKDKREREDRKEMCKRECSKKRRENKEDIEDKKGI